MNRQSNHTDPEVVDLRAGARNKSMLVGIFALVVIAGLVFAVVRYGPSSGAKTVDAAPDASAGFDYGRHKTKIQILRLELERAPCDRGRARDLVQILHRAGDYRGTIAYANDFLSRCDHYSRLLWTVSASHKQLGEYQESAEVVTRLIEERPHDSDFWWWRGEAYQSLDEVDLADADYRQSLATKPNKFAARRYLPFMGERTPCEVSAAIQTMIEQRPSQVASWMRDTLGDRYVSGNCDRTKGTGRTEIEVPDSAPVIVAEAQVNGHKGRFIVQQKSAFTILGKEFADKAQVSMTTVEVPVYAGGGFLEGRRAVLDTVAIGKASAPKVVAVVIDKVPGDVDGIIGSSFLWRFRVQEADGEMTIEGR